jgi:hypothetical protein
VIRLSSSTYITAKADSKTNAEAVGIVTAVAGADDFTFAVIGKVSGLSGLTAGTVYFLSPTSAGALTATEPTTVGQVSKPLLIADSTTSGYLFDFRGQIVTTGTTHTIQGQIPLDTPDASGNAYPALSLNNGFSNVRRVVPAFTKLVDGTWEGSIRIPQDYSSTAQIILSAVANATSGAVRWIVSTAVVASGVTEDTAYTAETAQNVTVPGTANQRFDTTFTLTTTLVAGSTLNVKVTRQGSNGGDTLAVDALLWECIFQYVGA